MDQNEKFEALLHGGNIVCGYVHQDGDYTEYMFQRTPENIASFIGRFPGADQIILADIWDEKLMSTFGWFINTCPDEQLLEEVKRHLIPIQTGETEPGELFFPTAEEVDEYYYTKQEQEETEGMRLE